MRTSTDTTPTFRVVPTINGGKTMVRTDQRSMLLYASEVRKHTKCDPLAETFHATVAGCYTSGVEPMTCGMVLDGMLQNEVDRLSDMLEDHNEQRRQRQMTFGVAAEQD